MKTLTLSNVLKKLDALAFECMDGTTHIHLMNRLRCYTAKGGVCAHVS